MWLRQNQSLPEIQQNLDCQLLNLDNKQKLNQFKLEDIGDFLPVGLLINHKNGTNLYMNKLSEKILNFTPEELDVLGPAYTKTISYDQEELKVLSKKIKSYFERNDESEILSFFQRVSPNGSDDYEWMYITSKFIKRDADVEPFERILIACPVSMMGDMSCKINRVLDENHYMKKNFKKFAQLTKREKEILSLVSQGHNNPAIAEMLFISRYTVEQHRKNINAKIECKNYTELIKFAEAFDLIK